MLKAYSRLFPWSLRLLFFYYCNTGARVSPTIVIKEQGPLTLNERSESVKKNPRITWDLIRSNPRNLLSLLALCTG